MTEHAADKAFYDQEDYADDPSIATWPLSAQFRAYARVTESLVLSHFGGVGHTSLELGAGTCSLSLSLSHLPALEHMICMDISAERMRGLAPKMASVIAGAVPAKLEHVGGSFNERLPFDDASVDLILFDAALHHASSPWDILAECRRVIRSGGLLVAQREQYLAIASFGYALRRLQRSKEVQLGVIENSFLRAQYAYFLRARGFEPRFTGVAELPIQRALWFLNGLMFSKWVIAAKPT
jgi:ubiquinone/menaquinone biosynthesis C-methylase UbiE